MPTKTKTRARKRPEKPAASRRCAEAAGSADRPHTRAVRFLLAEPPTDTDRLEWLIENHVSLTAVKEDCGEEVALWWQVTDGKKSLSGHPVADPREAIDAAVLRQNQ